MTTPDYRTSRPYTQGESYPLKPVQLKRTYPPYKRYETPSDYYERRANRKRNSAKRKSEQDKFLYIQKRALAIALALAACVGSCTTKVVEDKFLYTRPKEFDYIQEAIENTTDPDELDRLIEKLEKQQQTATSFRDGDFVYYTLKDNTEIKAKDFKKLFDIEDNILLKYNDLDSTYIATEPAPDGHSGYFEYDNHVFQSGDVIKVPVESIKTDEITFNY